MGKKNKETFGQNPFKSLKGFSVPAPLAKVAPPVASVSSERAVTEEPDFSCEMERFGVRRIEQEEEMRPVVPVTVARPAVEVRANLSEDELFLASLGVMQTVFSDELPEEDGAAAPTELSRRMKLVRQGKLRPEATLDLHGCTRDVARLKVRHFLENAVYRAQTMVLIVTGWGKSGNGEAVLRDDLANYLRRESAAWVSEWAVAPRALGGDGALVVFLKKSRKG